MTESRTIYVGSLWHQYCDPFVGVIGFDAQEVETKLRELDDEEQERCRGQDIDGEIEYEDDICGSGVGAERYNDMDSFISPGLGGEDAKLELEECGIAVI